MRALTRKTLVAAGLISLAGLIFWRLSRPEPVKVAIGRAGRDRIEGVVVNTRAGTLKACRRALLAPAVGGQIDQLPVREGMQVEAGTVLLSIWNRELQAEVELSRSELQAADAATKAACLAADIADREAERYRTLKKSGTAPEEEVDRRTTTARVKRAECEAAQAARAVRQGGVRATEAHLQRTILTAPFAGVIAEVNGEVGEYITPSPPGIQTLPAIDLVDTGCFYVVAPIDEVDAPAIKPGMAARITMDAFAGRIFTGQVRRIADYVMDREKQSRTVDIEVAFTGNEDRLGFLPGYSADAEIILAARNDALRVPTEAITADGHAFVFHEDTGRLEKRAIRPGISNWQYTEVTAGLDEGEQIVLTVDRKGVHDGGRATVETNDDH